MKNKISILIIASITALLALVAIQTYLISNTYELKKKAFLTETKEAIGEVTRNNQLDSISELWYDDLKNLLADYKNGRISKSDVLVDMMISADSINPQYKEIQSLELLNLNLGYEVSLRKNLSSLIVLEGANRDTIFSASKTKPKFLFGEIIDESEANLLNLNMIFANNKFFLQENDKIISSSFDLEIKTEDHFVIKGWKSIILARMASLLLFSFILFLFVIGLLYYAIKKIITQKKVSSVKTDFINNITHELKTPLATLAIATKSLKKDELKNNTEAFEKTLDIIDRQNDRLQKLIDQVMTNSLSSDDIVLSKELVSDNEYFADLINDFKLSTQHRDLQLINNIYKPEVLLRLDRFHMTTSILNILDNAVKYGNNHVIIEMNTEVKNAEYIICIKDNGIGIAEKEQEHIFEKLYRVAEGDVHNVKGLGLGLYYTSQIVKAHKGIIEVKSTLGEGSMFTIKIPIN